MSHQQGTVDVIVVGSGAAALTGAYTAAASGLCTLVLEKTGLLGGTSAYSGACLWLPGNDVLRRAGVPDTAEQGLEYLRATVGDRTPDALQEAYVRSAAPLVEFLERDPALDFDFLPFPDYFAAPGRMEPTGRGICPRPLAGAELGPWLDRLRPTVPADTFGLPVRRRTLVGGQALVGRLLLALDGTGNAEVRDRTPVRSLVVEDGRVVGVLAGDDGEEVHARLGVLVAAGGYECDPDRRRALHGLPGADWTSAAHGGNTGDALDLLQAAGAAVDLLDEAWWCPATLFPNGRAVFTLGLQGGIFVDGAGRRFANESLPYDRMGHELRCGSTVRDPVWWVFDSRTGSVPGLCSPAPDRAEFAAAGLWRTGETAAGLAAAIGVPAAELGRTLERFNGFARSGVDLDFHRGEDAYDRFFVAGSGEGRGPNPCLVPIDHGPLHAVRIVLGDLGSKGGALIDVDGRVLDGSGRAIPGLHAAGNSAASVAGHVYPGPGVPLGSGMVFAHRAARALHRSAQPVG